MYFFKFTQTKKGIVSSSEPLTGMKTTTKMIGGVEVEVREQTGATGQVRFGFTAISPELAEKMNLQVGDKLPLKITDKPVVNNVTGEIIPNLYWAH